MVDVVRELEDLGIDVDLDDPEADGGLLREEYNLEFTPLERPKPADAVVLAVAHRSYGEGGWMLVGGLLKSAGGFVAVVPGP